MLPLGARGICAAHPRGKRGYPAPSFHRIAGGYQTLHQQEAPLRPVAPPMAEAWYPDPALNNLPRRDEKAVCFSIHSIQLRFNNIILFSLYLFLQWPSIYGQNTNFPLTVRL